MRSCLLILHHRRMVNNTAVGTSTTRSARGLAVTETSAETDMSLDGEASLDHCRVVITKSGKRLVYDTCAVPLFSPLSLPRVSLGCLLDVLRALLLGKVLVLVLGDGRSTGEVLGEVDLLGWDAVLREDSLLTGGFRRHGIGRGFWLRLVIIRLLLDGLVPGCGRKREGGSLVSLRIDNSGGWLLEMFGEDVETELKW